MDQVGHPRREPMEQHDNGELAQDGRGKAQPHWPSTNLGRGQTQHEASAHGHVTDEEGEQQSTGHLIEVQAKQQGSYVGQAQAGQALRTPKD